MTARVPSTPVTKATRVHCWSDSKYNYTRTEHFLLQRDADAQFDGIPMDGSSKMENPYMESIETLRLFQDRPLRHGLSFRLFWLTNTMWRPRPGTPHQGPGEPFSGYAAAAFPGRLFHPHPHRVYGECGPSKSRYVLMPVWMLTTRYKDKTYLFAMNGQSGKMTGSLPVSKGRSAAWFSAFTALGAIAFWLFFYLF